MKDSKKDDSGAKQEVVEKGGPLPSAPTGRYKLHLYQPNGLFLPHLSPSVIYHVTKAWGDVLRCISSNRWVTLEDIVQAVWAFENKQYIKSFTRTRKQIEEGVKAGVEAGVILVEQSG